MAVQMLGIKTKFTDDQGRPLVGGKVHAYFAGTTTYQDTFKDPDMTIVNTNPIILDDSGSADVYLNGSYRIRIFDKNDVLIEEQDGVTQSASGEITTAKGEIIGLYGAVLNSLTNEVKRAVAAEKTIADSLTSETTRAKAAESALQSSIDAEAIRAKAAESDLNANITKEVSDRESEVARLDEADAVLQAQINSVGGGKLAYKTYAEMIADKSNIAAKSSIDIIADTDDKNGTYLYDGANFVKSNYDLEKLIRAKVQNTFGTYAQMVASNLSDGAYALVADDAESDDNGLYVKTAGAWVKSSYDVKSMAQEVADSVTTEALSNYFTEPVNLFSFENISRNKVIGADGSESDSADFGITDYIPVKENSEYTLKTTVKYATRGISFYDREKNFIKRDTLTDLVTKPEYVSSITIPSDVAYVRFNLGSAVSYAKSEIAFYSGEPANLSGYPVYHKPELSSNISLSPELLEDIRYGVTPYDFVGKHVEPPKNIINSKLFTESGTIDASGVISPLEYYVHTQPIRVKGGTEYVLQTQGNRFALRHIAWYTSENKFISRDVASASDADGNHVVLRSPVLARYCVVVGDTRSLDNIKNNVAMYIGDAVDPDFNITDTSAKLIDVTIDGTDDSSQGSNESIESNPLFIKLNSSFVGGYSLFNPATAEESTVITSAGEFTAMGGYFTSDYIPVSEGVYTVLGTRGSAAPFAFISYYNKDMEFIKRVSINYTSHGSEDSDKLLITIPSGVALVRLNGSVGTAYDRNRMFIKGDVPEDTAYDRGETYLTNVKLAQDVRFDARTPRFRTITDLNTTFTTNIEQHESQRDNIRLSSTQVYAKFDALVAQFPNEVEVEELGSDDLGNRIACYKIVNAPMAEDDNNNYPTIFINCGIHGIEKLSPTVMYKVFEQLLTNWRSNDILRCLRFNATWLVIPISNPSGWDGGSRYNHNGVDINRNFDAGWTVSQDNSGSGPFSEAETRAIASVIDNNHVDIFMDYHNFSAAWERYTYAALPPNSEHVKGAMYSYMDKLKRLLQKDYDFIPHDWTSGWVTSTGYTGMVADYAYKKGVIFPMTFELCSYFYPYANHLEVLVDSVSYDEVHAKVMYEATINAIMSLMAELQRY